MREYDVNKPIIDIILPSNYITDLLQRYFTNNADKIPCAEVWQAFQDDNRNQNTTRSRTGRTALFYAMERDGYHIKRFTDTNYFISPTYTTRRGRPKDSETITALKDRIKALEAENRQLKHTIREYAGSRYK